MEGLEKVKVKKLKPFADAYMVKIIFRWFDALVLQNLPKLHVIKIIKNSTEVGVFILHVCACAMLAPLVTPAWKYRLVNQSLRPTLHLSLFCIGLTALSLQSCWALPSL